MRLNGNPQPKVELPFNFSNLTVEDLKQHLNIEPDFLDDDKILGVYLIAAKDYVLDYVSVPLEVLDSKTSIAVATLLLASEFYENRTPNIVSNSKVNFVLKSILDQNRRWL